MLAFHASPTSFEDVILPSTPEEEFRRLLGGQTRRSWPAATHQQFVRRRGGSLFLNPGSVGLSYDFALTEEDVLRFDPWAAYAVVELVETRLSLEFRRAPFDPNAVADAIEASDLPDKRRAEGWRS